MLFGILISILPHLVRRVQTGSWVWLADSDETGLYLQTAAQAFHEHSTSLADPIFTTPHPTIYPWIQLWPGLFAARLLGASPLLIGLFWRILAGATVGAGWYAVTYRFLRRPGIAFGATIFLLADSGLLSARLVLVQGQNLLSLLTSRVSPVGLLTKPDLHPQWRIISPGLSLGFLLFHLWAVAGALEKPDRRRVALAAISVGLLFPTYFYFWTAVGLGIGLAILALPEQRRTFFQMGALGLLLGLPSLLRDYRLQKASALDWALRSDKFVPIGHLSELIVPKLGPLLLIAAMFLAIRREKDLRFLGIYAVAGLLLLNHQLVSGLQIENFHWGYFWGPVASLLVVLISARTLTKMPARWSQLAAGAIVLHAVIGLVLRAAETERPEPRAKQEALLRYQTQRNSAPRLDPNSVLAGDAAFVELAGVLEDQRPLNGYSVTLSPSVGMNEWNQRDALDAWLSGIDAEAYARTQEAWLATNSWGPWARGIEARNRILAGRRRAFAEMALDPAAAIQRLNVKYLALLDGQTPAAWVSRDWTPLQSGPTWKIWRRPDPH